jgi:hypothetical protein
MRAASCRADSPDWLEVILKSGNFWTVSLPRATNYGWLDVDSTRQCGVPDLFILIDCKLARGRAS